MSVDRVLRVRLRLPVEVHDALAAEAVRLGTTPGALAADAIRGGLIAVNPLQLALGVEEAAAVLSQRSDEAHAVAREAGAAAQKARQHWQEVHQRAGQAARIEHAARKAHGEAGRRRARARALVEEIEQALPDDPDHPERQQRSAALRRAEGALTLAAREVETAQRECQRLDSIEADVLAAREAAEAVHLEAETAAEASVPPPWARAAEEATAGQ